MGPGGLRGLQILLPGANHARGGFDSHASPPFLSVAIALVVLLGAVPAWSQPPLDPEHPQSPSMAALKSFLLPGLGQIGNDRWVKAGVFFGAYTGLLGWAVAINQDKQDAEGHYNAAVADTTADPAFWQSEVDRLESNRNAKYWFAGATMLLSVIDAYVDAHLRGFDKRIDATVGYIPEDGGGIAFALRTRWD